MVPKPIDSREIGLDACSSLEAVREGAWMSQAPRKSRHTKLPPSDIAFPKRISSMKKLLLSVVLVTFLQVLSLAQMRDLQIEGKEVFKNDDVVFHQIDEHTWVGTGHMMANESLYLVEGNDKAVLIDAGTKIADLDKIVASITKKSIILVATHLHPDHTGSAVNYFPEIYINEADAVSIPQFQIS
jgi:hypothetical protein